MERTVTGDSSDQREHRRAPVNIGEAVMMDRERVAEHPRSDNKSQVVNLPQATGERYIHCVKLPCVPENQAEGEAHAFQTREMIAPVSVQIDRRYIDRL